MNAIRYLAVILRRPLRRWTPAFILLCIQPLLLQTALAQWQVAGEGESEAIADIPSPVAEVRNREGYTLAIYRDGNGAIRARFALNERLYRLHESLCPSYQIDERRTRNRSMDNESCVLRPRQSEYILGVINDGRVVSRPLYELMNGRHIHYRFRLQAGGYDQTSFSLAGSKRTLTSVLGIDLEVSPR